MKSDASYRNTDGTIAYPLGSYKIKEVSAPKFYQLSGTMSFKTGTDKASVTDGLTGVIKTENNTTGWYMVDGGRLYDQSISVSNRVINASDIINKGSIAIYKEKADGTKEPLADVSFKLVAQTTGEEYTATTDQYGKLVWSNLIPQKYVITEVKTADGKSLLKDNIEVTLPMESTLSEIEKKGLDLDQFVYDEAEGMYCLYDLSYTIDNSAHFEMPITGGDNHMMFVLLGTACAAVVAGAVLLIDKKKDKTAK